jgi:hypothetical protein
MYGQGNIGCSTWFLPMITMIFVMLVVVNYGLIEEPSVPMIADRVVTTEKKYKNFIAPDYGTIRLSKGVATQIHHSIKNDSVIVLSRKTIDGRAGSFLVVREIVPNEKFVIEALDSDSKVEKDDSGEIFFVVY